MTATFAAAPDPSRPFVGQSLPRREDLRLLTGRGQYLADMVLPGMLHVVFVRSPVAHARIRGVDLSQALASPGVRLAYDGAALQRALPPVQDQQLALPAKWKTSVAHRIVDPRQPLLAVDRVRHVGEALAVIVAETQDQAEDALEKVILDLEALPAVVDPQAALAPGATLIHESAGSNQLAEFSVGKGDAAAAIAAAPRRLTRRIRHHRYAAVPMECRGVLAEYSSRTDSYQIWSSTQVVHWLRKEAAQTLGTAEGRIHCVAPDVGGGFGGKGHVYPEDLLIPFLAREAGCPVRWIESRSEHMQCACHSRDQFHEVEVGFDDEGHVLGIRDAFLMDCGAWNPVGVGIPYNTASHFCGPYRISNLSISARIVATNKVPNAPYRGAGRPEAAHVMERVMDLVARALGLEPAEVRRRNMVRPEQMPFAVGLPYRDGVGIVYDGGDYPAALEKALDAVGGLEAFRREQREARAAGRLLGLGIGCYTEGTGVGPFEGATVRVDPSGRIWVSGGPCPQGQGMETIFAQITADQWKVQPDQVMLTLADTGALAMGFGTVASRSTVNFSAAIHDASARLRRKVFAIAAHMLECAEGDLELRAGGVGIIGVPGKSLSLAEVARASRPGWDSRRPPGMDAGLEETFYWEPATVTWSYASHAAVVEVDPESGRVAVLRYAVAHDCGVVVNPMLAEGQIIGGAVQGIGGGLFEDFPYDENGQLLAGSLLDYALPTASDVPSILVLHQETPSTLNPLGVKGLGEGGAISPPVALANAVGDALLEYGIEINETPVRPQRLWRDLAAARARQQAVRT